MEKNNIGNIRKAQRYIIDFAELDFKRTFTVRLTIVKTYCLNIVYTVLFYILIFSSILLPPSLSPLYEKGLTWPFDNDIHDWQQRSPVTGFCAV